MQGRPRNGAGVIDWPFDAIEADRRVPFIRRVRPPTLEKCGEYVLSIDLPGFERDEIGATSDEGRLHVAADRTGDRERVARSYRRTFGMRQDLDADEIRAQYRRGVLDT
jgi:HSP20 family molecular chaperone IbpA